MDINEQSRELSNTNQSGFDTWSNDGDKLNNSNTLKTTINSWKEQMSSLVVERFINGFFCNTFFVKYHTYLTEQALEQ